MRTLIKNAHIVSPGIEISQGFVVIEDDKIVSVGNGDVNAPAGAEVIDANGKLVVPGFVDVHCHGRNNFDFCDGSATGVRTILEGKLSEGVTTILPTTLTLSEEELTASLQAVADCDKNGVCRVPGVHLEGPYINPKSAGAQNPAYVRLPDVAEVERLNAVYPVRKITYAVEQEGGVDFTAAMLLRGITPSCTHSAAKYADFVSAYNSGLRNLSHFCNQMSPLHHRDIGLVGAGLLHKDVFVELICDKLHINPAMIKLVFQVKGCDQVILITDAMRAAGMPDGEYSLGGLPVVVADGAARLREGGALAGSTLQLSTAFKNVAEVTGLPLSEVVKSTSYSAARALGLQNIGKIEPGYLADIVLLNDDFDVTETIVGGEICFKR